MNIEAQQLDRSARTKLHNIDCDIHPKSSLYARSDVNIFFWLPKTAGGTISAGIRSDPAVEWQYYVSPDGTPTPKAAQTWFGGHLHFGHHLIYNAQPVYFTILRDPIERLISEFFYHHQHKLPGIHIPDDEIVPAFIRMVEAAPHLNYCSYMFSDYCAQKETAHQGLPAWDGNPITGFELIVRRDKRYGYLTENVSFENVNVDEAFWRASNNLRSMRFIGFFDDLEDTVARLNREFGLNISLNIRMHETSWKPELADLPGYVGSMLRRKTEADYELLRAAERVSTGPLTKPYRFWRKKMYSVGTALRAFAHPKKFIRRTRS